MKRIWIGALVLLLGVSGWADDAPRLAKITKVFHDRQPQKRESMLTREVTPNEVGKFKELREDLTPKPEGEYITVIWKSLSRGPLQNVTVTLHFRQARTSQIQSIRMETSEAKRGTNRSEFRVIEDTFKEGGPITAWRADIAADGKPLDSFHSFLWKDPS